MQNRPCGNEYRTTLICVDSYQGFVPAGRFYNPSCDSGVAFGSLSQLLVKMQDMLDGMQFPQSFTVTRAFADPPGNARSNAPPSETAQAGKLATFAVRVLFRQNASWQGSVSWLEGNRESPFRSVLELILLMDSALNCQT